MGFHLELDSMSIEEEVRFTLRDQSGRRVPVTMSRSDARELAVELNLGLYLSHQLDVNEKAAERLIGDIQASEPHLQERIAATASAMSHDDLGDMMSGDRFE